MQGWGSWTADKIWTQCEGWARPVPLSLLGPQWEAREDKAQKPCGVDGAWAVGGCHCGVRKLGLLLGQQSWALAHREGGCVLGALWGCWVSLAAASPDRMHAASGRDSVGFLSLHPGQSAVSENVREAPVEGPSGSSATPRPLSTDSPMHLALRLWE